MKKLFYISALFLTLNACKKENNAIAFQGTYEGTFRTRINNNYSTSDIGVILANPEYRVTKGAKLASGTFKIEDKMNVSFSDKNVWTADFDPAILLNGKYTFQALGDSLILTKYILGPADANNYYQYRLKRMN